MSVVKFHVEIGDPGTAWTVVRVFSDEASTVTEACRVALETARTLADKLDWHAPAEPPDETPSGPYCVRAVQSFEAGTTVQHAVPERFRDSEYRLGELAAYVRGLARAGSPEAVQARSALERLGLDEP